MYSDDDIQYALEMTRVIREPDRRIDTFSSTQFEFYLISELMDSVGEVRVRNGRIDAAQPRILRPDGVANFEFEGFGSQAAEFGDWLERNFGEVAFLKYGFSFSRSEVSEESVHEPFEDVCGKVVERAESAGNPLHAVIQGVDDAWEICLLRFTLEMIEKSHGTNVFDFKRRGML